MRGDRKSTGIQPRAGLGRRHQGNRRPPSAGCPEILRNERAPSVAQEQGPRPRSFDERRSIARRHRTVSQHAASRGHRRWTSTQTSPTTRACSARTARRSPQKARPARAPPGEGRPAPQDRSIVATRAGVSVKYRQTVCLHTALRGRKRSCLGNRSARLRALVCVGLRPPTGRC